jgi:hypothetical protein
MKKMPRNFNRDLFKKAPKGFWSERGAKSYISKRVWKHFCGWMTGQTVPVLPNGKIGVYKHDVERYVDGILLGKPTYWD